MPPTPHRDFCSQFLPPSGESEAERERLSVAPTVRKWFASDAAHRPSRPRIGQMLGERCQPCGDEAVSLSPTSLPWAPTHEWWETQASPAPFTPSCVVFI